MMYGCEKSDSIVAVKPANNAERSAAELVEPRAGTKGNADQQSTRRLACGSGEDFAQDRQQKMHQVVDCSGRGTADLCRS
jgi:hypothetical protein